MLKIYKKVSVINASTSNQPLASEEQTVYLKSSSVKLPKLVTLAAIVFGAVMVTLVFSFIFTLLLIPLGIFAARAWWMINHLKKPIKKPIYDDFLETNYTVIQDQTAKDPKWDAQNNLSQK